MICLQLLAHKARFLAAYTQSPLMSLGGSSGQLAVTHQPSGGDGVPIALSKGSPPLTSSPPFLSSGSNISIKATVLQPGLHPVQQVSNQSSSDAVALLTAWAQSNGLSLVPTASAQSSVTTTSATGPLSSYPGGISSPPSLPSWQPGATVQHASMAQLGRGTLRIFEPGPNRWRVSFRDDKCGSTELMIQQDQLKLVPRDPSPLPDTHHPAMTTKDLTKQMSGAVVDSLLARLRDGSLDDPVTLDDSWLAHIPGLRADAARYAYSLADHGKGVAALRGGSLPGKVDFLQMTAAVAAAALSVRLSSQNCAKLLLQSYHEITFSEFLPTKAYNPELRPMMAWQALQTAVAAAGRPLKAAQIGQWWSFLEQCRTSAEDKIAASV